jgi:hypothetical protein
MQEEIILLFENVGQYWLNKNKPTNTNTTQSIKAKYHVVSLP